MARAVEQAAAAEGRRPMRGSTMLSASGDWVSRPGADAILRDAADAELLGARADRGASTVLPSTSIVPAMRRQHAGDHVGQLALAVARDAGDADDLAGMDRRARDP